MCKHIDFDSNKMVLRLLDQRFLPEEERDFICHSLDDVISAIQGMAVRGAPAIGVTAAYGCVLGANELKNNPDWRQNLAFALTRLANARPTAVNLAWAVGKMRKAGENAQSLAEVLSLWLKLAKAMDEEDVNICKALGKAGASLLKDGDCVLTHCNAGSLATAGYGTALGVIRAAREEGKNISVIADETRPLFQGSRLTAWELAKAGIPVKVACDNSCAAIMGKGLVQAVITGADRVAANGDAANKIGTLGVAIMANYYNIPFYIALPLSTVDMSIKSGGEIPIEERESSEVSIIGGKQITPKDVPVFNFAFDVTPANLINGIITEKGILRPPYEAALAKACTIDDE